MGFTVSHRVVLALSGCLMKVKSPGVLAFWAVLSYYLNRESFTIGLPGLLMSKVKLLNSPRPSSLCDWIQLSSASKLFLHQMFAISVSASCTLFRLLSNESRGVSPRKSSQSSSKSNSSNPASLERSSLPKFM